MRTETIGNATLYLGDCREILPTLPNFDLILTDPPYGINASGGTGRSGILKFKNQDFKWDDSIPDDTVFELIFNKSDRQIIFGGNYFKLPPSRKFIIWDKGPSFKNRSFAECEYAWCSWDGNAKIILRDSTLSGDHKEKEHPTQKPLVVIEFCLNQSIESETVCDPFMGSGTTGVACVKMDKVFTGIEREPAYFDIACRRIEAAYKQSDLFRTAV